MWRILEYALLILTVILFITQIILPSFISSFSYFWLFKKSGWTEFTRTFNLDDEYNEARKKAEEAKRKVKDFEEKAEANLRDAKEIKNKAKDLL